MLEMAIHWSSKPTLARSSPNRRACSLFCPQVRIRPAWRPSGFGFLSQRFSSPFATKPVRSETHKQNVGQWQPWFLVNNEQLPAVDSTSVTLAWDFVKTGGERLTVIRHDDRVLFSEPALWQGYKRFEQVCKIVREKYGGHVNKFGADTS